MKELQLIYRKRKQQILPLVFAFAAVFVLFRVIIPQWSDVQEASTLMGTKQAELKAKEESIALLNSIPDETINKNFETITKAVPMQKDIVLIYSELTNAAAAEGVKLGGFNVKIGGIYSSESKKTTEKTINGMPYVNIVISVTGNGAGLRTFAEKLYQSVPLVEIKSVDIGRNDARYDVNFYYKPVTLRPSGGSAKALEPLSATDTKLLEQLDSWKAPLAF